MAKEKKKDAGIVRRAFNIITIPRFIIDFIIGIWLYLWSCLIKKIICPIFGIELDPSPGSLCNAVSYATKWILILLLVSWVIVLTSPTTLCLSSEFYTSVAQVFATLLGFYFVIFVVFITNLPRYKDIINYQDESGEKIPEIGQRKKNLTDEIERIQINFLRPVILPAILISLAFIILFFSYSSHSIICKSPLTRGLGIFVLFLILLCMWVVVHFSYDLLIWILKIEKLKAKPPKKIK